VRPPLSPDAAFPNYINPLLSEAHRLFFSTRAPVPPTNFSFPGLSYGRQPPPPHSEQEPRSFPFPPLVVGFCRFFFPPKPAPNGVHLFSSPTPSPPTLHDLDVVRDLWYLIPVPLVHINPLYPFPPVRISLSQSREFFNPSRACPFFVSILALFCHTPLVFRRVPWCPLPAAACILFAFIKFPLIILCTF